MMAKNENKTINVNNKDYNIDDLNEHQIAIVNHITDLDRKLSSARFNIEQLAFGREAFINALAESLENPPQEVAAQ